jgi:hypothetical protein
MSQLLLGSEGTKMRNQFLILPTLFVALLTPVRAWTASTSAHLDIAFTAGQTIAAVNLSNSAFNGGAASGTAVGSVSVTMSPASPPFSGSLSLSGPNASNFQIVGSNLVTTGVEPAGTYSLNIVATQVGVVGSPLVQPEVITGTSNTLSTCNALTFTYNLVTDFGAVAGNIAATDAALHAFSAEAQKRTRPPEGIYAGYPGYYPNANKDDCIVLNIPAGTFKYTWNHFGSYIRHLKIAGAGSNSTFLQNTNGDGSYADEVAYEHESDYFNTSSTPNYGYFINQTNVGDSQVSLKSAPSNAGNFTVGRWVLVWSCVQDWFGGYPPNPRYYDYARVTSINTSTGVIGLDTPLSFQHRTDCPYDGTLTDGTNGTWGPARITPIDRPDKPIGVYQEVNGIHWLGNPSWNLGSQSTGDGAEFLDLIDGSANDLIFQYKNGFSMLRDFTISNSTWEYDEADKIVRTLIYDHDTVTQDGGHNGELLFHAIGGHITYTSFAGRHALYEGGVLIDNMLGPNGSYGIQLEAGGYSTADVTINGVIFQGNNNNQNEPIAGPQIYAQTIDDTVVSVTTGPNGADTRLKVQKNLGTYGSPSQSIGGAWGNGTPIMKNGIFVPGASITLVSGDASFIYVDVIGTTFTTGDTVWAARVPKITVTNNVGQNTGFGWGSQTILHGADIPAIVWSGNSGN